MSSKKQKFFQFNKSRNSSSSPNSVAHNNSSTTENIANSTPDVGAKAEILSLAPHGVQPEQISLDAYAHIQKYIDHNKQKLDKNDLNAVLRLSQHLIVFGLLSAVGYLNQSNAQENNETRKRTVPVWQSLLGQLIDKDNLPNRQDLMKQVEQIARNQPAKYMALWRQSLILANHWNFWARAYYQED